MSGRPAFDRMRGYVEPSVPASNVSEAWDTLREAVRQAGVLRTESVTITAPFARTLLTLLDGLGPKMELEPASNVSEGLLRDLDVIDAALSRFPAASDANAFVGPAFKAMDRLRAALAHAAPEGPRCDYGCDACRDFEALADEEQRLADATEEAGR